MRWYGAAMTSVTGADVYYDPYDVGINADPYPAFKRLRDEAPAYFNERYGFWALSRHADVEPALVSWETFSNCRSDILEIIQSGVELPPGIVMFEDPPLHTAHRGLMSRVFTPRRMAALEDQVRAFCVRSLDPLVGSDGFDIIEVLGRVMPMRVIGMLLGIPENDQGPCATRPTPRCERRPADRSRSGPRRSRTASCSTTTSTGGPRTRPTTS